MITKFTNKEKNIFSCTLRIGFYFILTIGFAYLLRFIASIYQENTFIEFGIVENLQLSLLVFCAFVFLFQSVLFKQQKALLWFFAALCGFALIRELDSFFEKNIPFISWKFCYLLPFIAGLNLIKNRKKLKKNIFSFCSTPAFSLMCTAMFIFIPVAQIIGNKSFISYTLPTDSDLILIRRFIEESCESIAYFLLLLSGTEIYFSLKKEK